MLCQTIRGTVLGLLCSVAAIGQVRTWVSGNGVDHVSCSRTAPCRTFTAAIAAVQAGGEVVVLESGGYGSFVVNKAVSIRAS